MQYVTNVSSWLRTFVVAVVCSAVLAAGQISPPAENPKQPEIQAPDLNNVPAKSQPGRPAQASPLPEIPVQEWLQGPARKDFPWDVRVLPPILTFQQRHLVRIVATFRAGNLRKAGVSPVGLYFVMKLAGEDGRWLPGDSHRSLQLRYEPAPGDFVRSLFGAYVQPGRYRIALMAYDPRTHKGNLWRGGVRVPPVNGDPLPGLERKVPPAEFLRPSPPIPGARGWLLSYDPWDFGQGTLALPARNAYPLAVDVVANLSLSDATRSRHAEAPDWVYQLNAVIVTAISHVISETSLESGCIRLSAMDIARHELLADREAARSFDWSRIRLALDTMDRSKIDARTLAGEKKTPAFLADYLAQLAADPSPCGASGGLPPKRVLIVVTDAFIFPTGTEMVQAHPTSAWARCFHLELVPVVGPHWDQIGTVLKPLNPVRLEVSTPVGFRKALAHLIHDMEKLSGSPAEPGVPR